jgi:hypothetical protein
VDIRSLLFATTTLVVGIAIGSLMRSETVAVAPIISPRPALATPAEALGDPDPLRGIDFSSERAEPEIDKTGYRHSDLVVDLTEEDADDVADSFDLTQLEPFDEEAARLDFDRFGDGPVVRREEAEDPRSAVDEAEPEANLCLPAYSSCRRDIDCCGASVCRSRVGSISGHFECTAS